MNIKVKTRVMKKIKRLFVVIISILIIASILLYATENEYIIKAARLTYL